MAQQDRLMNCSCNCASNLDRRSFLAAMGLSAGGMLLNPSASVQGAADVSTKRDREPATIRVAFLYPPSRTFADNPEGWWSWPGNEFDAEARQQKYLTALREMEDRLGIRIVADAKPVATDEDVQKLGKELETTQPDGLLLVMFYNRSLSHADRLLEVAESLSLPSVFFIGLGVKHGAVRQYRRPGVYLIQSLDNLAAIESGMRMINTRKQMSQSLLLSITEAPKPREGTERFFGTRVRVIPFAHYAQLFQEAPLDDAARKFIAEVSDGAQENRGVGAEAIENAARANAALRRLLEEEQADGLTMNCLRRGMLKPCISFAWLNDQLIPAACENDLGAAYTQLLGQRLTGRPGFQHNPCFETEANHYYASHCTCPTRLLGPDSEQRPYQLRRFAHTNEGSCAVQVFWQPGDPVTMVKYYTGENPSLDVYAGKVVKSHPMPPAAGCTTNVEIEITDRRDACLVQGHHNVMFCGDFARRFRMFAQLHHLQLADTGYDGIWPM